MERKKDRHFSPSKLAFWLLKRFCPEKYLDEVQGDLMEVFEWRKKEKSTFSANVRLFLDVISALRFFSMPKLQFGFSTSMLYSFVRSSFRNFSKNRFQTSLNVFGLSVGMAAALFILEYVSDELNYDQFSQSEDMYRVTMSFNRGDELMYETAVIGEPIAEAMVNELPQVEKVARLLDITRIWQGKNILSLENKPAKTFEEPNVYFADPTIIDLFDIEFEYGDSRLNEPNTIVVSTELAIKYFGNVRSAVGKTIRFQSVRVKRELLITGVFKYPNFNMQVRPSALISYATNLKGDGNSVLPMWSVNSVLTYVKVRAGTNPEVLQERLADLLNKQQPIDDDNRAQMHIGSLLASPITSIHLNSTYQDEVGTVGDANAIYILVVIALFIVVMAWINYINLSTATSMKRSKEVGVRKVMGAKRIELILQFFTETFLLNSLSLVFAIGLVMLIQPLFNQFLDKSLHLLGIDFMRFGVIMAGVFFGGILISGCYAAIVLSAHGIIRALKGVSKGNAGQNLRRGLIVLQLLFSSVLIIVSLAIDQQLKFMNTADTGMDMERVLVLEGPTLRKSDSTHKQESVLLTTKLSGLANVEGVSITNTIPGKSILQSSSISRKNTQESEQHEIEIIVGSEYLDVLGTRLLAGSGFDLDLDKRQVVINASAAKLLGFDHPSNAIGQLIYSWRFGANPQATQVTGVIEDYHHESLNKSIDPMAFYNNVGRFDNYYLLKLQSDAVTNQFDEIESIYSDVFPGNPVNYYYLGDFFNRQYVKDRLNNRILIGFVLIAIIVACLGLYGLASFSALQRTKEIGVRKVFGAKIKSLILMLSKEAILLSTIGFSLATPFAFYGISKWLDNYAFHIEISWWIFAIPMGIVFMITLLAVGQTILKAALKNPVGSLRYE